VRDHPDTFLGQADVAYSQERWEEAEDLLYKAVVGRKATRLLGHRVCKVYIGATVI
jgi:hypothetical protein